jgi:hypothetical protein
MVEDDELVFGFEVRQQLEHSASDQVMPQQTWRVAIWQTMLVDWLKVLLGFRRPSSDITVLVMLHRLSDKDGGSRERNASGTDTSYNG